MTLGRLSTAGRGMLILICVLFLVTLGLHATPARAPRLIATVERAWEQGLNAVGGWRAAWDERGELYYIRPGGGARIRVAVCLPAGAGGGWGLRPYAVRDEWERVVAAGYSLRYTRTVRACDVEAWWATVRWPTY